jgi:hypothetical protein
MAEMALAQLIVFTSCGRGEKTRSELCGAQCCGTGSPTVRFGHFYFSAGHSVLNGLESQGYLTEATPDISGQCGSVLACACGGH